MAAAIASQPRSMASRSAVTQGSSNSFKAREANLRRLMAQRRPPPYPRYKRAVAVLPTPTMPNWRLLRLDDKLPQPQGGAMWKLCTTKIGTALFPKLAKPLDFDLTNRKGYDCDYIDYQPLNDTNLHYFYSRQTSLTERLLQLDHINDEGYVRCTLIEYNRWRRQMFRLWLQHVHHIQKEFRTWEKAYQLKATYERARHVCGLPPRPNKFIEEGTQPMPSIRLSDDITQYGRENDDQRLARNHLDREQFIERARIEASCETEMARQYYVEMMKMRRYRALMLQARREKFRRRSSRDQWAISTKEHGKRMQRRYVLAQERREEKQREWLKRHLQFQLELSERQLRAQQERDESFRARTEKRREESKRQYEKWRDGYASSRQLGKPSSTLQPSSIIRSKPTLYDERGAGDAPRGKMVKYEAKDVIGKTAQTERDQYVTSTQTDAAQSALAVSAVPSAAESDLETVVEEEESTAAVTPSAMSFDERLDQTASSVAFRERYPELEWDEQEKAMIDKLAEQLVNGVIDAASADEQQEVQTPTLLETEQITEGVSEDVEAADVDQVASRLAEEAHAEFGGPQAAADASEFDDEVMRISAQLVEGSLDESIRLFEQSVEADESRIRDEADDMPVLPTTDEALQAARETVESVIRQSVDIHRASSAVDAADDDDDLHVEVARRTVEEALRDSRDVVERDSMGAPSAVIVFDGVGVERTESGSYSPSSGEVLLEPPSIIGPDGSSQQSIVAYDMPELARDEYLRTGGSSFFPPESIEQDFTPILSREFSSPQPVMRSLQRPFRNPERSDFSSIAIESSDVSVGGRLAPVREAGEPVREAGEPTPPASSEDSSKSVSLRGSRLPGLEPIVPNEFGTLSTAKDSFQETGPGFRVLEEGVRETFQELDELERKSEERLVIAGDTASGDVTQQASLDGTTSAKIVVTASNDMAIGEVSRRMTDSIIDTATAIHVGSYEDEKEVDHSADSASEQAVMLSVSRQLTDDVIAQALAAVSADQIAQADGESVNAVPLDESPALSTSIRNAGTVKLALDGRNADTAFGSILRNSRTNSIGNDGRSKSEDHRVSFAVATADDPMRPSARHSIVLTAQQLSLMQKSSEEIYRLADDLGVSVGDDDDDDDESTNPNSLTGRLPREEESGRPEARFELHRQSGNEADEADDDLPLEELSSGERDRMAIAAAASESRSDEASLSDEVIQ